MLRLLVSPKWIAWHVLTLGAMAACGFLSAWQWHRAGSAMGSVLNVGYGVQWPIFAVFFGFMWWRFLRMELRTVPASPAPADPATPDAARTRPENDRVSEPLAPASPVGPSGTGPEPVDRAPGAPESGDGLVPSARTSADAADRPSPFTPRPAGVGPSRLSDAQTRAYNEALAELAARDRET